MPPSDLEFELRQNKESLEFALQSGRMGTWDINLETNSIKCSQVMLDLWGVSTDEFKGQRSILQSKVHPDDLEKMNRAIDSAIINKSIYELEYRIFPLPGVQRWVFSRGRCTFSPDSPAPVRFAGIVYDITEIKDKEEALSTAANVRDQFLMTVSHELKTPLTCLQLQMQVMEMELKHNFPEAYAAYIIESGFEKQKKQLERINRILDNILDVSKISEGHLDLQLKHFDLTEMTSKMIEKFKTTAVNFNVDVKFNATKDIVGKWDPVRLEQVLINLLINALRYGNNKPIHVDLKKDDNQVMILVRDEGEGIDLKNHPRVFGKFASTISENDVSGIGLGLFISNYIVRAHGGEIRLVSEIGKGSEFAVILPGAS